MIPFTHHNVLMIATAVSIIGVIFLLRELNKTREELYELREFSEDVMERLNGIIHSFVLEILLPTTTTIKLAV